MPQAIQVADRFHWCQHATDALVRYLTRQHTALRQAARRDSDVGARPDAATATRPFPTVEAAGSLHTGGEHPERRARRVALYEEARALHRTGMSGRAIATHIGVGRCTVQRWLQGGPFPERRPRGQGSRHLAPVADDRRIRWAQGCHDARHLWRARCARGFVGGYGCVARHVGPWRGERYRHRGILKKRHPRASCAGPTYTPRQTCWLLLRASDDLTNDERAYLTRLYHACPQVAVAEALVEECATVLRERDADGLYRWLRGAEASRIKERQTMARSLWLDRAAVEAAVRMDWSNGPVEGSVNKLKTTKRARYGRASLDLLRRRLRHVA